MSGEWDWGWNAVAAIGQAVGAIITAIAVVVALWTANLQYRKRVKVIFYTKIPVGNLSRELSYGAKAINVGQRPIPVSMIGFWIEGKQLFNPDTIGICQKIINPSESVEHVLSLSEMKYAMKQLKYSSKIYAFMMDEEGEYYKSYIGKRVNYFLH
jgi:hypothetical protein